MFKMFKSFHYHYFIANVNVWKEKRTYRLGQVASKLIAPRLSTATMGTLIKSWGKILKVAEELGKSSKANTELAKTREPGEVASRWTWANLHPCLRSSSLYGTS